VEYANSTNFSKEVVLGRIVRRVLLLFEDHLSPAIAKPLLKPFAAEKYGPFNEELTISSTASSSCATRSSLITFLLRQPVFFFPIPITLCMEETPHGINMT
jgi:hypothetical protein